MLLWIVGFFILLVGKLTIILECVLFFGRLPGVGETQIPGQASGPLRAESRRPFRPASADCRHCQDDNQGRHGPEGADSAFFLLAPAVVALTALLMFSVVLWRTYYTVGHRVPLVVTDLNIGLLFVFAM